MTEGRGLRLPSTLAGVGETAQQEIHSRWSTYENAKHYIETVVGLKPPEEPKWAEPVLTLQGLTESTGKDYTEMYMQVTGWFGYLGDIKARVSAQILERDREMKFIEAKMREAMRDRSDRTTKTGDRKAPPAGEMDDKILLDARYSTLGIEKQGFEQVVSMLNARITKLEYEIKLISRQVEIKRTEFEHANREGGINGQRGVPLRTPGASTAPSGRAW